MDLKDTACLYQKRPCVVVATQARRHKNKDWGTFTVYTVRFLDAVSLSEQVTAGTFHAKAKPITGIQGVYWNRVADLLRGGGMALGTAQRLAMQEQTKAARTG